MSPFICQEVVLFGLNELGDVCREALFSESSQTGHGCCFLADLLARIFRKLTPSCIQVFEGVLVDVSLVLEALEQFLAFCSSFFLPLTMLCINGPTLRSSIFMASCSFMMMSFLAFLEREGIECQ